MKAKIKKSELEKHIEKVLEIGMDWEIVEMLIKKCDNKPDMLAAMVDSVTLHQGGVYIKTDSMLEKSKIEDFVGMQIYPHYSDQQIHLFTSPV